MDFSKFDKVENTFERKGGYTLVKEQEYDNLKYRKAVKKSKNDDGTDTETVEGRFFISNKFFGDNHLATLGLRQFTAPDGETVLAVVHDADASILKLSKKSKEGNKVKNFKSPKLEAALEKMGLINSTVVGENQFIDLTSVAKGVSIKGVSCIEVFSFSKGAAKAKTEHAVAAEPATMDATPASAPVAEVKAAGSWD